MFRIWVVGCCMGGLVACTGPGHQAWWHEQSGAPGPLADYRFDWELSGDPDLAPLQVFDDGRHTWLQYPAGAPVPALFERRPEGDRLLHPQRETDYLRIRGVPSFLVIRGGQRLAYVRRGGTPSSAESVGSTPAGTPSGAVAAGFATAQIGPDITRPESGAVHQPAITPLAAASPQGLAEAASTNSAATPVRSAALASEPVAAAQPAVLAAASVVAPVQLAALAPEPVVVPVRPAAIAAASGADAVQGHATAAAGTPSAEVLPGPVARFGVTPVDGTLRKTLSGWARESGWVFEPEHWAVDVDIPVAGSATFPGPFKDAVRSLLAATELGDRPVQPCFYANQVLRVISLAQRCDRTRTPGDNA